MTTWLIMLMVLAFVMIAALHHSIGRHKRYEATMKTTERKLVVVWINSLNARLLACETKLDLDPCRLGARSTTRAAEALKIEIENRSRCRRGNDIEPNIVIPREEINPK
ncbi:MAG: hypothetical protein AMS21_00980 [Gemmatimonas sp. SG8_38_2]|nr:MAG: hypothetical protein AMS21_00980 [Gemmatimonas sp. SG8_38_2]